ncbi:MAG: zinc ribbon domain-containing protein [Candidatus Omnitrophica bacterium]|nr:zinc ribbon domain-containing protein [Candidatus Omnitrophota bacterium]
MPTYEYECTDCGHCFEELQSMLDKKLKKCPKCGKMKLERLIGRGGGIIFKGTGFYETDFKTKSEPKKKESDAPVKVAPKTEAVKSDAKSAD